MLTYRCPHCSALMRHKPSMAGERVACSKCSGEYFEPTDPLPGMRPEIAPPADDTESETPISTPAATGTPPPAPPSDAPKEGSLANCDPQEMIAELQRRGLHAVQITWPPGREQEANMAFSTDLGRDGANEMILEIAMHLIGAKWPELQQLLSNYRKQ